VLNIFDYLKEKVSKSIKNLTEEEIKFDIETVKNDKFGDFSSNVAMQLTKILRDNPRNIATKIVENFEEDSFIGKIDIAGPGFINFFLSEEFYHNFLNKVKNGNTKDIFTFNNYKNDRVHVEFVSANPTGPLNVVSARAAAVGDSVSNLIIRGGAKKVEREFYVNDAGNQVLMLANSVKARYEELLGNDIEFPENGYHGAYILDIAKDFRKEYGDDFDYKKSENIEVFRDFALAHNLKSQDNSLKKYGVIFDKYYSEKGLRESKKVEDVFEKLKEKGETFQADGAVWFEASKYGDEKDRVLITKEGNPTYFLPDIAYHYDKLDRGNDWSIGFWGPDHHGYFCRLHGALQSLGFAKEKYEFRIVQQINLLRGGETVKMSKRTGEIISMDELIDEVGVDSAKFSFLMRTTNAHLDFDIEVAKKKSDENPVFYIQYAHARICSILRTVEDDMKDENLNWSRLIEKQEITLIKKLYYYNSALKLAINHLEPHRINHYLLELAKDFHNFYQHCRVIVEDKELSKTRYSLINVTRKVIADALSLLGISAPERM